jgi:hypothetical protein
MVRQQPPPAGVRLDAHKQAARRPGIHPLAGEHKPAFSRIQQPSRAGEVVFLSH